MVATPVKLDSNTDIVRGSLFLFLDGQPLAFEKSSTLNISVEAVDISNKTMGGWSGSVPGKKSFSISSEMLITRKTGTMSYDTLLQKVGTDSLIEFMFGDAKVANRTNSGGDFSLDTTKPYYAGSAWCNSLDLVSNDGELCTSSAAFTGTGALERVPAIEPPVADGKSTK